MQVSISENNGIKFLRTTDRNVYSIGISTGGAAEIRMATNNPERHVIASTIDRHGAEFAKDRVDKLNLSHQIEIRIQEQLCIDFERSKPAQHIDNLIEVLATKTPCCDP
jgi:hypothetical protein